MGPGRGSGWPAVGGGGPSSPPLASRGPGHALGWRRAGESGRVFPPPLGHASQRHRARPSLVNPAPAPARVFPTPGTQPLRPGSQSPQDRRPGGRVQIRAREVQRARGAERCQHGKWGAPGAGAGLGGWGRSRGLPFPATLAKPQPRRPRSPSKVGGGARVRCAPRCPLLRSPKL